MVFRIIRYKTSNGICSLLGVMGQLNGLALEGGGGSGGEVDGCMVIV